MSILRFPGDRLAHLLASSGNLLFAIVGQCTIGRSAEPFRGRLPAAIRDLFPTPVRVSAVACLDVGYMLLYGAARSWRHAPIIPIAAFTIEKLIVSILPTQKGIH
jgi:hypothetical protein